MTDEPVASAHKAEVAPVSVVVAGEALVDLAPRGELLAPLPGGAPYNVAVGLARLGTATRYLGRLSRDGFGELLSARLRDEGVALDLAARADEPTTLAVVHLDADGAASYAFYLAATSAAGLTTADLPALPSEAALHVSLGALALTTEPAGAALQALLARERGHRVISLDPNVRPSAIGDPAAYREVVEDAVTDCDAVKVSDEDLHVLHPGEPPIDTARRWATLGPALVVMTRGGEGATAFAPAGEVAVDGEPVDVVDTIGAGDAFTSGLLAWLAAHGELQRPALAALSGEAIRRALRHATRASALACTRPGADPPRASELA